MHNLRIGHLVNCNPCGIGATVAQFGAYERLDQIEEKVAELEFLAVQVDGEITFPADWRERHGGDR